MNFDQDTIKDLAVYAVQQFVSNQVPLDDSIAEKARALNLNEDQVKRVIESTNVIAFLKLREGAEDKTFEFQVASFPGVMDSLLRMDSDSSYIDTSEPEDAIEKVAFDVSAEVPADQAHQVLSKSLYHIRAEIEKVAQDQYNCAFDLEKLVPQLVKQANWQERLQTVTQPAEFERIMGAFNKSGFEKSASYGDYVFVGKELETARKVVDLIKQASELPAKRKELEAMEKKAVLALGKFALAAGKAAKDIALHPIRSIASGAGTAVGLGTRAAVKGVSEAFKTAKRTKMGVMGVGGLALTSATYQPKINPHTGRPDDVWNNIYH